MTGENKNYLFTSESVSEDPDKVSIRLGTNFDALLEQDKHSRVAVETLVKLVWW